jgi:hypothetical protein
MAGVAAGTEVSDQVLRGRVTDASKLGQYLRRQRNPHASRTGRIVHFSSEFIASVLHLGQEQPSRTLAMSLHPGHASILQYYIPACRVRVTPQIARWAT